MDKTVLGVWVKLWVLLCAAAGVTLTRNAMDIYKLAVLALIYIAFQKKWRIFFAFAGMELLLCLLLYLIRFYGWHMVIFSEFYVLLFYQLMPVFIVSWDLIKTPPGLICAAMSRIHMPSQAVLGILVTFRFFPAMKAELKGVGQSMKNRGLIGLARICSHPAATCEYILVPMLLRCLQLSDQLSISALVRGIEAPGRRGSYYERQADTAGNSEIVKWIKGYAAAIGWSVIWTAGSILFIWSGGA